MNPKRRCDAEENAKGDPPPTSIRHPPSRYSVVEATVQPLAALRWGERRLYIYIRYKRKRKTTTEQKRRTSKRQGLLHKVCRCLPDDAGDLVNCQLGKRPVPRRNSVTDTREVGLVVAGPELWAKDDVLELCAVGYLFSLVLATAYLRYVVGCEGVATYASWI